MVGGNGLTVKVVIVVNEFFNFSLMSLKIAYYLKIERLYWIERWVFNQTVILIPVKVVYIGAQMAILEWPAND